MQSEKHKTAKGKEFFRPVLQSRSETEGGFCIACGTEVSNVEPDARNYDCEVCGNKRCVYGIEELILMGIAKIEFGGADDDE